MSRSEYARNVLKVMSGTVVAQAIMLAAVPLLSRYYPASAFGALGVYVALANLSRVVSCLRLDFAMQSSESDEEAWDLLCACVSASMVVASLVLIGLSLYGANLDWSNQNLFFLVSGMLLVSSLDNIFGTWASRKKKFRNYSTSRVIRALAVSCTQVAFSAWLGLEQGLLLGLLVGEIVSVLYLINLCRLTRPLGVGFGVGRIWRAIVVNRDNCLFLLPGHAMNVGVAQLPILAISTFYGSTVAGYVYMAQRLVSGPGMLLGTAIFKVFLSAASEKYHRDGECRSLTVRTLAGSAVAMTILMAVVGVAVFFYSNVLLGPEWDKAVPTVLIYALMEIVPATFYPISGLWVVTASQRLNLRFQIGRSIFIAAALAIGLATGSYYATLGIYGVARTLAFLRFALECVRLSGGVRGREFVRV